MNERGYSSGLGAAMAIAAVAGAGMRSAALSRRINSYGDASSSVEKLEPQIPTESDVARMAAAQAKRDRKNAKRLKHLK